MTSHAPRHDVLIVGGRCAGAATAMLLARAGLRVLVLERGGYGTETLSTHALMRGGVMQLARWGLLPRLAAAGTPAIRTTTFHYGAEAIEIAVKPADGVEALLAPRRSVLDALLVDAAVAAGAEVRHGETVLSLLRDAGGRVRGAVVLDAMGGFHEVVADLVIGADGIGSTVARLAEARDLASWRHASATVFGYWAGLTPEGYHWHYREGVSAGAIRTNGGLHCVFAAVPQARFRAGFAAGLPGMFHQVLTEAAPGLAVELGAARQAGALQAFAGRRGFLRQAHGPGWALVGDAGAFRDPITAHGITDALRDAEALAAAVLRGGDGALADYAAARDATIRPIFDLTDEIASFAWDLPRLKELHKALNQAMKRGVARMRADDALRMREGDALRPEAA